MKTEPLPRHQGSVLKIVFLYALFAGLWILLSDHVLAFLVKDANAWAFWSTAKGWLFVAVTATLLYALIARLAMRLQRSHNALLESEAKYRFLLDMLPQFVYLKNAKGEYVTCNRTYANALGIEPSEIAGKTDFDFHPMPFAETYRENDKRVMVSGMVLEMEQPYQRNGHDFIMHTVKTPIKDTEGRVIGVLGISWDITEQKRAEETKNLLENRLRQSQKMEAIGTLAGGIAHDFNNILSVIISSAELSLLDTEDMPKAFQESYQNILNAANRAHELVKQILAFSRKAPAEHGPLALEHVAQEAQKFIRAILPRTIEVNMEFEANLPPVLANSTQIHQIFVNLCTNAAGAMKNGHGQIDISLSPFKTELPFLQKHPDIVPGIYVCLTVRDNGHGMDEETQTHIFDPFFTTKGPGEGTGLGLSVVHGIVKALNGFILVNSILEQGTEIRILLPPACDAVSHNALESSDVPPGKGQRILCVDDEVVLVEMLAQMLLRLGYKATTQHVPADAIEMIASAPNNFDLVVTDMTMPGMTGVEVAQAIRKIRSDLPIILFSGYSSMVPEETLHEVGIDKTLMKPVNMHVLGITLAEIFEKSDSKKTT